MRGSLFTASPHRHSYYVQILESGLARAGVPYSYGFAIILLTVLVKAATYPLSKKSVGVTACGHLHSSMHAWQLRGCSLSWGTAFSGKITSVAAACNGGSQHRHTAV